MFQILIIVGYMKSLTDKAEDEEPDEPVEIRRIEIRK